MAELAYAAASRAALLWVQIPPGLPEFFDNACRRVGRTVRHLSAKQGLSQEANGFDSRTLRHPEGTAEWPATGPENQGMVMSHGRSIRLPSAKFAQVREPGWSGPAVTRFLRSGTRRFKSSPVHQSEPMRAPSSATNWRGRSSPVLAAEPSDR